MIDIKFLQVIPEVRLRSGLEFLDWQDKSFYTALSDFFEECVNKDFQFMMGKEERNTLAAVIKKHSNISVNVSIEQWGNAAIDAGYINPHSVLNINNLDNLLAPSQTKTGELMKKLKTNILKGWCDLKTGKVEGDFKQIQFTLYLAASLPKQCMENAKRFPKGVTLSNVLASIVLHEVGHAFFGLNYITSTVVDNAVSLAVVKMLVDQPDKNRKAVIVKNVKELTEVDLSEALAVDDFTPESALVIFTKGVANRDSRRALSLGVASMTNEVLADAYSIRMGGSAALISFLAGKLSYRPGFALLGMAIGLLCFPALTFIGGIAFNAAVGFIVNILKTNLVSGIYDTPYRRVKNILRENIAFINTHPKGYTPAQLAKAKSDALALEKIVEGSKTFWESTWLQRWLGFTMSGGQFRKNDFEHYTAELASSRLVLHTNLSSSK